jgi:hypothetical protein
MHFRDIVNQFTNIEKVHLNGCTVSVKGTDSNNLSTILEYEYNHKEVAKEVSRKVSMFIGI